MSSYFIRSCLIVLVLYQVLMPCNCLRTYGSGSNKYGNQGYKDQEKPQILSATSSGLPSDNYTRKGLGLSAWGIVVLIVTLILAGMGFYYFSICYPILCKKTRKYDMIGLPSVA